MATRSSTTTAAVRKTRSATGTRPPSRAIRATAKAVSVVVGMAQPLASDPDGTMSRYKRSGEQHAKPVEGVSDTALEMLEAWDWPGNIRELENAIEHAMVMVGEGTKEITPELLPRNLRFGGAWSAPAVNGTRKLADAMAEAERSMLITALNETNWDLARAADTLGITERSMAYSVKKHNLAQDKRSGGHASAS